MTQELFVAIDNDDLQLVKEIIDSGVDINCQDEEGYTPLLTAVDSAIDETIQSGGEQGEEPVELIVMLLSNGADVNITNFNGLSPLGLAKEYKSRKIIALLESYAV